MNPFKFLTVAMISLTWCGVSEVAVGQSSLGASDRKKTPVFPWHQKTQTTKKVADESKTAPSKTSPAKTTPPKTTPSKKPAPAIVPPKRSVPAGGAGGVVIPEGTQFDEGSGAVEPPAQRARLRPRLIMVQPPSDNDLTIPSNITATDLPKTKAAAKPKASTWVKPEEQVQISKTALLMTNQSGASQIQTTTTAPPPAALAPAQMIVTPLPGDSPAMRILIEAATGPIPSLRSNAMEALHVAPQRVEPLVRLNLSHDNPGVRFAAIATAGTLKLQTLTEAITPHVNDPDPSVKAAALYALHTLGANIDISPLAQLLSRGTPGVRANVAMLLGMMGDPSAVGLLRNAGSRTIARASEAQSAVMRIQVAEAIAKLGDNSTLSALRAGAYSRFGEVRILAISAMGAIGDQRMGPALERFLSPYSEGKTAVHEPLEIQLAAAASIARLGNRRYATVPAQASHNKSPMIRAQAAWVMGWYQDPTTGEALTELLADSEPMVRVSAAASLVRRNNR